MLFIFCTIFCLSQGNPSCEISSTNTGGSDESSSTPQDGDESDLGPDTDDELDSPVPDSSYSPERKFSSERNQLLYAWKEVSDLHHDSQPVRMRNIHSYNIYSDELFDDRLMTRVNLMVYVLCKTNWLYNQTEANRHYQQDLYVQP